MASLGLPSLIYHPVGTRSTVPVADQFIDPVLQSVVSQNLRTALSRTNATRGGVVVIDARSGAIKALVSTSRQGSADSTKNIIIDAAWEPGSVIKPLTIAAAINEGAVDVDTTFFDSGETYVDGFRVTNAVTTRPRTISLQDIITDSINTGTINVLRRLGDGKDIDAAARQTLYRYFTERYRFGPLAPAGLTTGVIPSPTIGKNLELIYANMAFGQSMTLTPLQLVSAYGAVLNGGTYYQPQLNMAGSHVLAKHIVSEHTSATIRQLLQSALASNNASAVRAGYTMGGKSGTAHVATLSGTYFNTNRDDGTYIGYISDATNMYVMLVRLDQPITPSYGFASTLAKQTWTSIVTQKIDSTHTFTK